MPEGLGVAHCAIGEFLPVLPEMVDYAICSCRRFRDFGGLVRWHIQDLDSPCCDFYLVVVEMAVPLNGREFSGQILGYEIFHPDQGGLGISGFE